VLELPIDRLTARVFLKWSRLDEPGLREVVARYLHDDYRRKHRGRKAPMDPALARSNEELLPSLKESNLAQADDIPNKLSLIGKKIDKHGEPLKLSEKETSLVAEAEHGRWVIERLAARWHLGGERQVRRGLSPYLKPWAELDDETPGNTIVTRKIRPALSEAGWGVVPIGTNPTLSGGHCLS
jgi:hypothetical protein